ncbi:hypothetical protein ACFPM0_29800 [Pseudonocardia sulfidoxydans]|uniref:hypothetical protein n=1 Tax=Pseudonocardia sulfidoxydans TaxID=54011 RepID=UPI003607B13F
MSLLPPEVPGTSGLMRSSGSATVLWSARRGRRPQEFDAGSCGSGRRVGVRRRGAG